MPLNRTSLIEASAGTGKTYTITGLYLRLLLGINEHGEKITPLTLSQILVVTFTEAATAEIKARVRSRLKLLRDRLLGEKSDDEIVNSLFRIISEDGEQGILNAFKLLDAAVKSMEEAAIYTIHGFCQRMLKQHAFESNMAFNLRFILEQSTLIEQAVKDYWRSFVYPLPIEQTQRVLTYFKQPSELQNKLTPLLSKLNAQIIPVYTYQDALDANQRFIELVREFKKQCIAGEFISALENSDIKKNKAVASKKNLAKLSAFCSSDELEFSTGKSSFELWHSSVFEQEDLYKKGGKVFDHEILPLIDDIIDAQKIANQALPIAILGDAMAFVKKRLVYEKQQQQVITPDDLLTNLFSALKNDETNTLANKIATQYPVALIDEFQDTDAIQYGIFKTIYNSDDANMVMIGDPKQAIYGFRGADIFTYIQAKHEVQGDNQYTLATNFRSSLDIVNGVNALFSYHDNSFIFDEDIPFNAVNAKGKSEKSAMKDTQSPIQFVVYDSDGELISKSQGQAELATIFAARIAKQLQQGALQQTTIADQPIEAKDICVLVRSKHEANMMKQALQRYHVSSVFLSRDSVYQTELAYHLLNFLTALDGEYNESRYRGLLVGPLFGLSYQQVYALKDDPKQWQSHLQRLSELYDCWQQRGIMAMLETLVASNNLPSIWHTKDLPVDRWLTDYRHLAEILQQKQLELDGNKRLLHWFNEQLTSPHSEGAQLRLESDDDLVKIVTMHGSKGLEYPVVYIPFVLSFRDIDVIHYHHEEQYLVNLAPDDESKVLATKEQLAEDIRLLYVALTRAIHQLHIGLFHIKDGAKKKSGLKKTAFGHLLFNDIETDDATHWLSRLAEFSSVYPFMTLTKAVAEDDFVMPVKTTQHHEMSVKPFNGQIERNWRITSFSAMTKSGHHVDFRAGADDESHHLDWQQDEQLTDYSEFTFPKGAKPGSCLHGILENIEFNCFDDNQQDEQKRLPIVIEQQLNHYGIDAEWQDTTVNWITTILNSSLNAEGLRLNQLAPEQCLVEMEFMLPLKDLNIRVINEALYEMTDKHFSALNSQNIQGMLTGFIDLIFSWQGQYFILDYKSNYLGANGEDYHQENMEEVMASHHYHLQYLLYSVALHRLLKQRLKDYDINRHLGGVYYLFLRGMPSGSGVYYKKIDTQVIEKLDALFGDGSSL